MSKIYTIILDNKKIGTSLLEQADAPMGIVFGVISFIDKSFTYSFLSKYCKDTNIKTTEYPEDKLITTMDIPTLRVLNETGAEIKGESTYINGMDSDAFYINIIGISYPFYEQEFPNHTRWVN